MGVMSEIDMEMRMRQNTDADEMDLRAKARKETMRAKRLKQRRHKPHLQSST